MSNHLDYEINKELGECYLFMGEMDKAEEYYQKAAGSNGAHPDPYLGLATIALQRGELDKAWSFYSKAAEIEADDKSLTGMALVELEMQKVEEAFNHLSLALDKNPENLIALYNLVRAGSVSGKLDNVVARLRAYLNADPNKVEVRYSLAGCLITLDRKDEAKAELNQILAANPANDAARDLLATL